MQFPLEDVHIASQCLRYYKYSKGLARKPPSKRLSIIQDVIKSSYLTITETEKRPSWRKIVGQVDTAVFKDVQLAEKGAFEVGRRESEYILSFLSKWYNTSLMKEDVEGLIDIPLSGVVNDHGILATAPIIKLSEPISLLLITELERDLLELYNDLWIRGLMWLIWKTTGTGDIKCQHVSIGILGGYIPAELTTSSKDHERTEKVLGQVIANMVAGHDYPSVTEKCLSCPFRRRCRI